MRVPHLRAFLPEHCGLRAGFLDSKSVLALFRRPFIPSLLLAFLPRAVTPDEVKALYAQFLSLKGEEAGSSTDLHISSAEFQAALGFKGAGSSAFLSRIFQLFDENGDGQITFEEFMHSIAVLTPTAAPEAKLKFAFKLYDADKRGAISPADVKFLLAASFAENGIAIADGAIDKLVADTFTQYDANRDGLMDFAEFKNMCTLNPNVLKPLTLNVSEMIASANGAAGGSGAAAGDA